MKLQSFVIFCVSQSVAEWDVVFRYPKICYLITCIYLLLLFIVEGLYEAIGEYQAVNQDEISIKPGDTVQVINRSMDGWWEIRWALQLSIYMKCIAN